MYNTVKTLMGSFHMLTLYLSPPFQTDFTIRTNCHHLSRSLFLKHGKYIEISNESKGQIITALEDSGRYRIEFDGKITCSPNALSEIDHIVCENTHYDERFFALHGAAVGHEGKAYLFLAATTGGKTTLASYLSGAGFEYITDDCILLHRTSFAVYPYQTPIHLREGGLQVLKRLQAVPLGIERFEDGGNIRYAYMPENCADGPTPLGGIFFIQRTESENQLTEMSTTEKMAALMKAPITDYAVSADYLKFISALAGHPCRRLCYSRMDFVAEVIRDGR